MSLLSTPTARPEKIFSLCSLVNAMQGRVKQSDAKQWLAPKYRSSDHKESQEHDRVQEVFRASRDLGLLKADNDEWVKACELPTTRRQLAMHVHAHLRSLPTHDPDAVLLRAYAWCVSFVEKNETFAILNLTAAEISREISASLGKATESESTFNTTKLTAWKDWMVFLGLGWKDLPGISGFLPDPARRIAEELPTLTVGQSRMVGDALTKALSSSMPYLDGGSLFIEASDTQGVHPPKGQASRILSNALRALHDDGVLKLVIEGDTKKGVTLSRDPLSEFQFFSHVEFSGPQHV